MKYSELGFWLKKSAEWVDGYYKRLKNKPVRPTLSPGEFRALLPNSPPQSSEPIADIVADFERIVPDAMTHWQHPRFLPISPPTPHLPQYWLKVLLMPWVHKLCCGKPHLPPQKWSR